VINLTFADPDDEDLYEEVEDDDEEGGAE